MVVVDTVALYNSLDGDLLADNQRDPATVFAKEALRVSLLKKFSGHTSSESDARALDKFLKANSACETWGSPTQHGFWDAELLGTFREECHKFFCPNNREPLVPNFGQILDRARVGPGAAVGSEGNDLYTKLFSSDLSSTSEVLYRFYLAYVNCHPELLSAEKQRIEGGYSSPRVKGSRFAFVPKTTEISRTICIEPSLNMYFQLGLGQIITRRLYQVFRIDLSAQPDVNRELARIGSLSEDLVTLDLESASDTISWKMIESMLPRDFVYWLRILRSPYTELPNGEQVQLHMVSSMGNGFTFPLQTALFSCAVAAVSRFLRRKFDYAGVSWSVFGDDIICRREIAHVLIHLLELLGFSVNQQKSFLEGPFRESCGSDFYRGQNVRGVYIKRLRTKQDICVAVNLLNRWSARTGVYLPRTIRTLMGNERFPFVPVWDNDDSGIKVPYLYVQGFRRSKRYQSILYRRYASVQRTLLVFEAHILGPGGIRRFYNSSGLFQAFLAGALAGDGVHSVVRGRIGIRHGTTLYRLKTGVAPNWDSTFGHPLGKDVSPRVWSRHVLANLKD